MRYRRLLVGSFQLTGFGVIFFFHCQSTSDFHWRRGRVGRVGVSGSREWISQIPIRLVDFLFAGLLTA